MRLVLILFFAAILSLAYLAGREAGYYEAEQMRQQQRQQLLLQQYRTQTFEGQVF